MKKCLCRCIFAISLLISTVAVQAISVPISTFQYMDIDGSDAIANTTDMTQAIFIKLVDLNKNGIIYFDYNAKQAQEDFIRSEIDAARYCEIQGKEVVVYGKITKNILSYDMDVKIYNHAEHRIVKNILLRSTIEDLQSLLSDAATKLFDYFTVLIGPGKSGTSVYANNLITSHTVEWWGTIPPWSEAMTTVVGYQGTLGFRFGTPVWTDGNWTWYQDIALAAAFHFGMNSSKVIDSQLYDIDLGPLLSWAWVWQRQQELRLSLEPCARIHVLNYTPSHAAEHLDSWVWYGGHLSFEYIIWLDAERTFGMGLSVGATSFLTEPFYMDYRAGISFCFKGPV